MEKIDADFAIIESFERLPDTKEKVEVQEAFLNDELNGDEFVAEARKLIQKHIEKHFS